MLSIGLEARICQLEIMLGSFTPATPVDVVTVDGVAMLESRWRHRRQSKPKMYCALFNSDANGQGAEAEIVGARFMVYKTHDHNKNYQCKSTHEEILRAYQAFRLWCGSDIDAFLEFAQEPITELRVPILPISPDREPSRIL